VVADPVDSAAADGPRTNGAAITDGRETAWRVDVIEAIREDDRGAGGGQDAGRQQDYQNEQTCLQSDSPPMKQKK
jgi:hypothetical protein